MGKIIYEPKKKDEEQIVEVKSVERTGSTPKAEARYNSLVESIDSVRPVGDTQCEYGIYFEDYAYTYTYQYATTDMGCEHSGVLLGEYYPETKEMIICGIMPIAKNKLSTDEEWINEEAIESLMVHKEKYFPGSKVLGWFHMQPGYGTMLTMKEVKIHRALFDRIGTALLLVDPINKIETFYAYEEGTLKEQTGYFLYYDKNPCMQQYMLDNPFWGAEKEVADDTAVHQFREIGKIRKKEYQQRQRTNFTVVAASIAILALGAVVIKMSDQNKIINKLQSELQGQSVQASTTPVEKENNKLTDEQVQFIINPPAEEQDVTSVSEQTNGEVTPEGSGVTVVDNTKLNLTPNQTPAQEEVAPEDSQSEEVAQKEEASKEEATPKEEVKAEEAASAETSENVITYKVQEGDTLRKISFDHYKTEKRTKDIIALNGLENGDQIFVGQVIKLPEK